MSFVDVRLPKQHGYGTVGGPAFKTEIVVTANRRESRNQAFRDARRRYDLSVTARTQSEAEALHEFHAAMGGALYSFRFWDALDYKLSDSVIGIGDGSQKKFQVIKTYTKSSASYTRIITKPLLDGFKLWVNATLQTAGAHYVLDLLTGEVTFATAPAPGATIKCSGQFDVPVRFVEDELRWVVVDSTGAPPDKYLWRPEALTLIEVVGE
jgi:uncharacterized protein (TIGR02217 family)